MSAPFAKVPTRAASDKRLCAADHRVLIAICSHANAEGLAYLSLACIASETGIARHNVCRSIPRLEELGYLRHQRHKRGAGLWDRSSYNILLVADSKTAPSANGGVPGDGARDYPAIPMPTMNGHDHNAPAEPFDLFWRMYPSRDPHSNPKKPAAQKFAAAVKRGVDPAVIIAGAQRYADYVARENTDPQYIKQAVTWLNQEQWNKAHKSAKARPPRARVGAI